MKSFEGITYDSCGQFLIGRKSSFSRRAFIQISSCFGISACGGGGGGQAAQSITVSAPNPVATLAPNAAQDAVPKDAVGASQFYDPFDGANLQPAFQRAINFAAENGKGVVFSDFKLSECEMWCPKRTSPHGYAEDGIPLVVKSNLTLDFRGMKIKLRGYQNSERMDGQIVPGQSQKWLGGWLYLIGSDKFSYFELKNVFVDGGYKGSIVSNADSNLTDKAFRLQDTVVDTLKMVNVELCNFAGEIYYIGGNGPNLQVIENCYFHGSGQCAFNPGGTGRLEANKLRASHAYQVCEVIGGKGHVYKNSEFFQAGNGGATFFGGPSPGFKEKFPYNYSYWDGLGEPPWITFENTNFRNSGVLHVSSWTRGEITCTDTAVYLNESVGHLRSVDLNVISICDEGGGFEAVGFFGIPNLQTQLGGAPVGFFLSPPSDISVRIECRQTAVAQVAGRRHRCGVRLFGGYLDVDTCKFVVSGVADLASEVFVNAISPVQMPQISLSGFRVG